MKSYKQLLLTFLVLALSPSLKASHYLGGEIYWRCNGNGDYIFTLTLYRDCTGTNITTTPKTINGPVNVVCNFVSQEDVSPDCPNSALELNCADGDPGSIQKFVFESNAVSLNGVPPANGWEFSWTGFARPTLQNANGNTGYFLRSIMYPYFDAQGNALNTANCYDNSPVFAQDANAVTCPNFLFEFNHLPSDRDIDSLVFDWASPKLSASQNIAWDPNYNFDEPFPDADNDPNNGPNTLDRFSGEITTLANDPSPGWYASCVVIREYRCGQLIGEVYRDVPVHYLSSGNCPSNPSTPSAEIDTSIYQNVQRTGNVYRVQTYPKDTVQFRVVARDLDQFANGAFQEICMKAGGLQLNSNNYASNTGCNGAAPCATLTSFNGNGTYCSVIQNTVEFFWVPDCVHLNFGGCGSASNTYYFTVRMEDDGCAAPKVGLATIIVEVIAGDPSPPDLSCVHVNEDGSYRLSWAQAEIDSSLEFNYYRLYGSNINTGQWEVVDSIPHFDTLSTDIPNGANYSRFYMEMSTGPCDFISKPSREVEAMSLSLTAIPPSSPEIAQLSWTDHHGVGLDTTRGNIYEIWVETPRGSDNWQKLAETSATSYNDTVSVCDMLVSYQIRVPDTLTGCYSGSNQDTGRFQDRNNTVHTPLSRVFVNQDNKAMVEFNTDPGGDIVAFYLLHNDPQMAWIIVDTIATAASSPIEWGASLATSRSEQFKVVSVDSCGNQSDDLAVSAYTTIHLKNDLNKCEGYTKLSWNEYERFPNGVHEYRVWTQVTEADGTVLPPTILKTLSADDTTYRQSVLQKDYTYCYYIEARDTIANLSSTSNTNCIEAVVPQQSRQLYISRVSNDLSRESIDVEVYVDGEADVRNYQVQRAPDLYGPYQTIATLGKPTQAPYIVSFQDFGVDPQKRNYYYRLSALDSCGGYDTISNISTNIRLQVKSGSDMSNRLTWNAYQGWGGYVERYEVYRRSLNGFSWEKIGENVNSASQEDTTYTDYEVRELVDGSPESGQFCYYIKAIEGGNPQGIIDNEGNSMSALSNEQCSKQDAKAYIPTAFRPESSVEENQSFGPTMRLAEVDNYRFYIVNRWGKKVFETNTPGEKWDGNYQGDPAPQGVYVYYLKYQSPDDGAEEDRGKFTLVR